MATYSGAGTSSDLATDIGVALGALADGDALYVGRGSATYTGSNDTSAKDLLTVETLPGFFGDFPEASPLKIVSNRTAAGRVRMKWSGKKSYLKSTGAGVIYWLELEPAQNGQLVFSDADNEITLQRSGNLQAVSTADINKYYACGFAMASLLKSGPTMAECVLSGNAYADLQRAATLIAAYQNSKLLVSEASITPTNVYVNGGTIDYRGGNGTNLYLYGGVMDLTGLSQPITFTNRYAYEPTVILLKRSGVGEPTWTNKVVDYNPPEIRWV